MHIGMIGAAAVAQAVAAHAVRAGHKVTLSNSRGPESLAATVAGLGAGAHSGGREAAAALDMVLLAVPWPRVPAALEGLAPWSGRMLLDATNHFLNYAPDYRRAELGDLTSSEIVAELAPDAKIVKIFNTLPARLIAADPAGQGGRRVLFLSGDDAAAKRAVSDLVDGFGFSPIDLGSLAEGGRMQQLDGPLAGADLLRKS